MRTLRKTAILTSAFAVAVGGASVAGHNPAAATTETTSSTATGHGGAAATEHPLATQAAIDVLDAGGNAVDAAVAASAVQSVVRPFSGGIGGGGYMSIYLAETDEFVVLDHQSTAPASFGPQSFIDQGTGAVHEDDVRASSGPAAAIPGQVKGWEQAVDDYGSGIPFGDLLQPAVEAARGGFTADENLVREISENAERFCIFPATAELYLEPGCVVPQPGTILANPDLADTLELIAQEGSSVFYEGEVADAMVDTINQPQTTAAPPYPILPGNVTAADVAGYEVNERDAISVDYRGYQVHMPPPSSSGGTTVGEALNILEGYDLAAMPAAQVWHYYIEAARHAFVDQQHYLGDDTTFSGSIPVDGLLSQGYADQVRQKITERATTHQLRSPGDPSRFDADPSAAAVPEPAAGRMGVTSDFSAHNDGAAWEQDNAFSSSETGGAGSAISVQDEAGSMIVGSARNAYVRAASAADAMADSEALVRFRLNDIEGDRRLRIWLRADTWERSTSPRNGYGLEISTSDDTVRLIRTRDGNEVHTLETFTHPRSIDWQWLRYSVEGDRLTFRLWNDAEVEPRQSWTGELRDSSVSGTGTMLMSAIELSGGAPSAGGFTVDEVTLTELNPTAMNNPFEGATDGASWDSTGKFTTQHGTGNSKPEVGAGIDVVDEQGRMTLSGEKFSYARAAAEQTELTDSEILVRFKGEPGNDRRLRFWLRADDWNTLAAPSHGYGVEIKTSDDPEADNVQLLRVRDGNSAWAMRGTRVEMDDGWHWLRFSVRGGGIKAKVWADGEAEPLDWTVWRGDEEIPGPGTLKIAAIESTGGASSGGEFLIDQLSVFDHDAAQPESVAAAEPLKLGSGEEEPGQESTIHLSTSDNDGNVVSFTHTLSYIGGNAMVVPGYGFLLNNQLSGRTPDNAPEGHPNAPRPGMRPVSTQAPTIVMKDGEPVMALGSPGGDTIVTTVLQVLVRTLDLGQSLPDALAAPRVAQRNHSLLGFTLIEPEFADTPEYEALRSQHGHELFTTGMTQGIGSMNAIAFLDDGRVQAVAEPTRRGGGSAMVQLPE
ncbi:hypothetical protein D9V41_07270 [Aeromicrobium phragmitis]|uniref:Gamma-glutamyltransferase n=1 Tax=Aeromicrobium phragmitis TaxID=2478914 RepID=A0A3L8PP59_9ACTN|nr:gamma-glutamyltransferase [Aeromicrobium phragmitis]RLV56228.1 hypothetical protein D9V41_07270 [Aeromicrobium phragmitis]